jgi:hypothetical protein
MNMSAVNEGKSDMSDTLTGTLFVIHAVWTTLAPEGTLLPWTAS